jgi:hypothetical protein
MGRLEVCDRLARHVAPVYRHQQHSGIAGLVDEGEWNGRVLLLAWNKAIWPCQLRRSHRINVLCCHGFAVVGWQSSRLSPDLADAAPPTTERLINRSIANLIRQVYIFLIFSTTLSKRQRATRFEENVDLAPASYSILKLALAQRWPWKIRTLPFLAHSRN